MTDVVTSRGGATKPGQPAAQPQQQQDLITGHDWGSRFRQSLRAKKLSDEEDMLHFLVAAELAILQVLVMF